jgi:hypothetical protein
MDKPRTESPDVTSTADHSPGDQDNNSEEPRRSPKISIPTLVGLGHAFLAPPTDATQEQHDVPTPLDLDRLKTVEFDSFETVYKV